VKAALIQVSDYMHLGASGCNLQSRTQTHAILVIGLYTSHGCCDKKALMHNAENLHMSRLFCEVYKVIKFVSDLRHVSGFLRLQLTFLRFQYGG
jgi:hypothetical protein